MITFVYFILGSIIYTHTDAKGIKLQIESDDIIKIINGVMSSDTFRKFAAQIVQRDIAKRLGYNNPYHPEDELVNRFDAHTQKEANKIYQLNHTKPKKSFKFVVADDIDPLDKENDNFLKKSEVVSDDALTDNEIESKRSDFFKTAPNDTTTFATPTTTTVKPNKKKYKIESETILARKDGASSDKDDRVNFKPRLTRFLKKGMMT